MDAINEERHSGSLGAADQRLLLVSIDAHVGPPFEAYRQYCPKEYLGDFDEFKKAHAAGKVDGLPTALGEQIITSFTDGTKKGFANLLAQELIHYDPHAALQTMDADGVAAEAVYHGAINGNPIPFLGDAVFGAGHAYAKGSRYAELARAGIRMYNRWLADYCSVAPERLIGLAQLPMWDPDLAAAEAEFARGAGLRGLNFPAPRKEFPDFNDPAWEPLWSAAESLGMPLNTHGGSSLAVKDVGEYSSAGSVFVLTYDLILFSRRAVPFMIFGGVFERHPGLRLVLTEQPAEWVEATLRDLDGLWNWNRYKRSIPRPPSEYFRQNCLIGGSFMSNAEAKSAVQQGLTNNVMWGRDFPHLEGTWPFTRLSLRKTMEGIEPPAIQRILGGNALDVFGLDAAALTALSGKIGPTLGEVMTPLVPDDLPEDAKWTMAFRGATAWS